MKILITGASGKVGRALRRELSAAGHSLRLADVRPIENAEGEPIALNVADGHAVSKAMEGIDAVAHLAFGSDLHDDSLADITPNFDVNVKGTYFLLEAAKSHGVKRFVYTSTLSVFGDSPKLLHRLWNEHSPAQPRAVYGLTKYMGEDVCRYFAERHKMSIFCLRLCSVRAAEEWEQRSRWHPHWFHMGTHVDDVARAIHLALTVPHNGYEVLHIAADNPKRPTEIARARQVLGFRPRYRVEA